MAADRMAWRVVLLTVLLLAGLSSAHGTGCSLPVETKVGCATDDDCVGSRICIDGRCSDYACVHLCWRQCDMADDCGLSGLDDCAVACEERTHEVLAALPADDASCKAEWISESALECSTFLCDLHCTALCERGRSCLLIEDAATCEEGCRSTPPAMCDPEAVSAQPCTALEQEARCAEARGEYGPAVDCNDLPCEDDYDCEPDELCDFARCLQRCTDDYECPNAECYADACTDPVGTPCDPGDSWACAGGYCINADNQNHTTPHYYCTILCILVDCPIGYECFDDECRECAAGCG